jgi:hypothetical protein
MEKLINDLFRWCVEVLVWIGDITGMGYELANLVIFVFLQPILIIFFFILWLREKKLNNQSELVSAVNLLVDSLNNKET